MMRRRDFLRTTLVTAGAVVVPAACTDDEPTIGACDVHDADGFFPQSVASGDPKPDSVVLWTRVVDGKQQADLSLALAVALDPEFTQLLELTPVSGGLLTAGSGSTRVLVTARAAFDHCVKVKVTGLTPGTTYYYRFYYTTGDACYRSRMGRTRTAPAPDEDVPVRFAFVSCQDYIGRYYNAYAALAKEELDFVVHLGDYIYETTGDPSFQSASSERTVTFSDADGALALTSADGEPYHAARTLSNYRELYRTYRSDPKLQAVHERFPMIATWDDHEFSNDCHGATATYFDGRQVETDEERRKAANQAWFEYMPVDYPEGDDFAYDREVKHPDDIKIYRDFTFGKHVHLVMTDLRSYRADHLIPEDAFPGKIVVDKDKLNAVLGGPPVSASPCFDIDGQGYEDVKKALEDAASTLGFDPSFGYAPNEGARLLSGTFVKALLESISPGSTEQMPTLSETALGGMDPGFSYADLGKTAFYGAMGSRYLVVKDVFDVASTPVAQDDPARAAVMGEAQEAWFLTTMQESKSTWKVWGNEYCLSQLAIDLTTTALVDERFKQRFYMSCDGWDGFRHGRNELLEQLAEVGNVVAITGDIHAFLAGTPAADGDPSKKIVEFVGSSISSSTFHSGLVRQIALDPLLSTVPDASFVAESLEALLVGHDTKINPHLAFADARHNGFCIAEANATEFVVSMYLIPENVADMPLYGEGDTIEGMVIERFKTVAGESELYKDDGGTWKKWDPEAVSWA
ncbi:alkaline phosphatase D family protein [Sorangium sp. So ce1036]|uniref:alkaline phosphatase D family protein n=1 Tax=Sorangium sp. So ce1036 TaxID=3133328 RepID=UPI003F099E8B